MLHAFLGVSKLTSQSSYYRNSGEATELRQYLTQVRSEIGARLLDRVFDMSADGKPSKWWTCFARRKFLKSELKK